MAFKVIMPKQGLQMTEGVITKWIVPEGGQCSEGEPLFEMETDKLTITMDSPATGTLLKIVHPEGDEVPITKLIAVIGEPGEDISAILAEVGASSPAADSFPAADDASNASASATPGSYDYDVAVIGGGPGGYVAAIRCAQYGKKTVLVEKRDLGGTCLNRGCIPTKALLHTAEIYEELVKSSDELGLVIPSVGIDFEKTASRKDAVVSRMVGGIKMLLKKKGVDVVSGKAEMTGPHTLAVDGKAISASDIILAMGSEPVQIPIPGIDREGVLNSDGVLSLTELPDSVVIIGGGVIGIEFATLFSSFGKKVTVVEALPRILNTIDADAAEAMAGILTAKGVDIYTGAKVTSIEDGLKVVFDNGGETNAVEGEMVVVAIGRRPVTKDAGLDKAGVMVSDRGFVDVDSSMRTNVPNIYAIGDITGKIQLAHVASHQGFVAAANIAGKDAKMEYAVIPSCIYSTPEIAAVGLTEAEAKDAGYNVKVGVFSAAGNGRSVILGQTEGFVKIVTESNTGEILGCVMVAPRATDMISEISVAMTSEATIDEIADTVHPHPTVSEMIMEAAHDISGLCVHKA